MSSIRNDGTASGLIITTGLSAIDVNAFTFATWVKASTNQSQPHVLDLRWTSTPTGYCVLLLHCVTDNVAFSAVVNDGANLGLSTAYEVPGIDRWFYVGLTLGAAGAGNAKLLMWNDEGTLIQSNTQTQLDFTFSTPPDHLGMLYQVAFNNNGLDGLVKYPRIWSTPLSQVEIEAEQFSPTPVKTSGLWGAWKFNGESDINDYSGNGHHWSPSGGSGLSTDADEPPVTEALNIPGYCIYVLP
jgi:hypothetical protein